MAARAFVGVAAAVALVTAGLLLPLLNTIVLWRQIDIVLQVLLESAQIAIQLFKLLSHEFASQILQTLVFVDCVSLIRILLPLFLFIYLI